MLFIFRNQEGDDGNTSGKGYTNSNKKGKYATSTENRRLV